MTKLPPECNSHPDAPHGFDRNGSLNEDRYVCDCESWVSPDWFRKTNVELDPGEVIGLSVEYARDLAAALLAAADYAEKESKETQ